MEPSSPSDRPARNSPNPSASGTGAGLARRPRSGTPSNEAATNNAGTTPIPDDEHGADLPLTMSASVVLTGLPRDAHQALADVEALDTGKGMFEMFSLYV